MLKGIKNPVLRFIITFIAYAIVCLIVWTLLDLIISHKPFTFSVSETIVKSAIWSLIFTIIDQVALSRKNSKEN